ncbi:hypothetical protein [Synechococcus sp. UW69]|uniref:hypothetical protein n=1 Tax=Synechococcus sp. UW69 TaxID=368493 RepID=UPI00148200EA|nr:hypothetical protein [Synechococcus sp. UW69]
MKGVLSANVAIGISASGFGLLQQLGNHQGNLQFKQFLSRPTQMQERGSSPFPTKTADAELDFMQELPWKHFELYVLLSVAKITAPIVGAMTLFCAESTLPQRT